MGYPTIVRGPAIAKHGLPPERLSSPVAPRIAPINPFLYPDRYLGVPLREPVNPAEIFRRLPYTPPKFGLKVPQLPRIPRLPIKLPLGPVLDAVQVIPMLLPTRYKLVPVPELILDNGYYYYPYPYNGKPAYTDPNTTFTRPLTGQYVGTGNGLRVPPGLDPFGIWIPSDINPIFNAHFATMRHTVHPGVDISGLVLEFEPELAPLGEPGVSLVPAVGISTAPGTAPGTSPAPPYWALPYMPPHPLSDRGPSPGQKAETGRELHGDPFASLTVSPSTSPVFDGGTKPRTPPADENTKEKKMTTKAFMPILHKIVGQITEAADWIKAVHSGLPKSAQAKPVKLANGKWRASSPQEKLGAIYDHWDELEPKKTIMAIVKMEASDMAIGIVNQRLNKNLKWYYDLRGSPFGMNVGPALDGPVKGPLW